MSTEQTGAITKGKYRPEIDGLRAFAVVAVIINHFNKDILPGGYLGVDIFFVISGYVITSSLYGRPSKNFKDFISGFYERRIKRLVPALSVFVVITTVLAALFISPHQGTLFLANWRTGISSLFGLSNLYLYKQATDYFGASSELNAFMHTWSLGVEEQFYLIFPFLVWFSGFAKQTNNGARNLFFIVTILSAMSMTSFIYIYSVNQPASYFLMPSRFWEMAGGCLIFIGFQKRASIERFLEQISPLLVLSLIIAVMYLPEAMAIESTIAIVVLSSILIASLKEKTSAYKLFTHNRVVYIGLISYSLYLWHWAVLAASRWTIGISWWSVPFQIAVLFLLSDVSYRYIETPFRRTKWKRSISLFSGIAILLGGAITVFTISSPLKGMIYLGQTPKQIKSEEDKSCNPRYRVVFVGDSHAAHYEGANRFYCNHLSIETLSVGGTPYPTINYTNSTSGRTVARNKSSNKQMEDLVNNTRLPKSGEGVVVVSIRAPLYFYENIGSYKYDVAYHFKELGGSRISRSEALAQWVQKLNQWISSNPETDFILLSPTPDFADLYPEEVCSGEWFQSNTNRKCKSSSSRPDQEARHKEFSDILRTTASNHKNSSFVKGISLICADNFSECETELKGKRLYSDDNHLNEDGAREVFGKLLDYLESNGKFLRKS
ncbi:MAG: acyltransferase family protein [Synechococcus sp. WH 8007]|nr:acyltransferase family protein [Synechococcus sp. WH 8007]